MLLKYCSQLLPPVMILPLQLHSECKKNTPATAEIWPGQGRKQQEFPAAVVNKTPELFSSCKILLKCSQLLPPVLNLQPQIHSECQKKKSTHHCRTPGTREKKTQYTPSCFPQFIKKYLKAKKNYENSNKSLCR
jgi:hypothetical protein